MSEDKKIWILIGIVVIVFCAAYGYELEYYRQQDNLVALQSYCARPGAVKYICEGVTPQNHE